MSLYDFIWDSCYPIIKEFPFSPKTDIIEDESSYTIFCEVPGYEKKELKVLIEKDQLIVKGKKESKDNQKYLLQERNCNEFKKVYDISTRIDKSKIDANLKNGILIIKLNKKEIEKPLNINIG